MSLQNFYKDMFASVKEGQSIKKEGKKTYKSNLSKEVMSSNLKMIGQKPPENRPFSKKASKSSDEKEQNLNKNEAKDKVDKSINFKQLAKKAKGDIEKNKLEKPKKSKEPKESKESEMNLDEKKPKTKPSVYKTKAQFNIDNRIRFKENIEEQKKQRKNNKTQPDTKTESQSESHSNSRPNSRPNSQPTSEPSSKPKKKKEVNRIRLKRSELRKEVANFLLNTDEQNQNKEENKKSNSEDNKKKAKQNYVRANLKKGYNEKKRIKPLNIRKYKLNRGRMTLNYQKKALMNASTDKYLGKGASGIDDLDVIQEDMVATNSDNTLAIKELEEKLPVFSKGFLTNERLGSKDDITPAKGTEITQHLTTALKSSLRKCVPLDTELKFLSKEFRYLLSDKKEEIAKLNQIKEEELNKKLQMDVVHETPNERSMITDNEEGMCDEDIAKLETEILQNVLSENFGYSSFLPGQLDTIKSILNNKKTLSILPQGGGKSLCFELPSLVMEGFTIVISPLLSNITNHLTTLPSIITGASLTSYTTSRQREEIFKAIREKRIKVLFTTPERFMVENFSELGEISLICIDEASSACPMCPNYRSSFVSCKEIIVKLKPSSLLLLSNHIGYSVQEYLVHNYKVEGIINVPFGISESLRITISKDENKLAGLVKFLRNPNVKGLSTVIFCNSIKSINKITSFLNGSGINASSYHSGKDEIERQLVQNNFMKDKIKLIVCTSSFATCLDKKDVKIVVIFEIPSSIETLVQEFGKGACEGNNESKKDVKSTTRCHIFLNDDDYFNARKIIYSENIDKTKVLKFVDLLFNYNRLSSKSMKRKRNHNEMTLGKKIKEEQDDEEMKGPKEISFNFTSANELTDIKKQAQLLFITSLISNSKLNEAVENTILNDKVSLQIEVDPESNTDMKLLGIGPCWISVRFYKTSPEQLAQSDNAIKIILEHSKEKQGSYTFPTNDVCNILNTTYQDLLNHLFKLQSQGEISYETKEEGAYLKIDKTPKSLRPIMNYFHALNQDNINQSIRKLNSVYILLRQFCTVNVDSFLSASKSKSGQIKCLSTYKTLEQYEEEVKKAIEKYFINSTEEMIDVIMAGNEMEKNVLLPIYDVDSQKEKNNLIKEIEDFTEKELNHNISVTAVDIINILFGIIIKGKEIKSYMSSPLWGKYLNYNYDYIFSVCESALIKAKTKLLERDTIGKEKLEKKTK